MNTPASSRLPARPMSYLASVVRQRCPRCHRGFVYRRTLKMNNRCPACGMAFNREPGFFTGASMIGPFIAFPVTLFFVWIVLLLFPDLSLMAATGIGFVLYLPLLPITLRLSRVLWLEIGRVFSPEGFGEAPPDTPPDLDRQQVVPTNPTGGDEAEFPEEASSETHENEHLHVSA